MLPILFLGLYGVKTDAVVTDKYIMSSIHDYGPTIDVTVLADNHDHTVTHIPFDSNTYNSISIGSHISVMYSNVYNVARPPDFDYTWSWLILFTLLLTLFIYEVILLKRRFPLQNFINTLTKNGKVIYGNVVTTTEQKVVSIPKWSKNKWTRSLSAKYELISPQTQKKLYGKFVIYLGNPSSSESVPQTGTRVAIFYLNDNFYRAL